MKCLPLHGMKSLIYENLDGHFQFGWKDVRNKKLQSFNDQPGFREIYESSYVDLFWYNQNKIERYHGKPYLAQLSNTNNFKVIGMQFDRLITDLKILERSIHSDYIELWKESSKRIERSGINYGMFTIACRKD